MSLVLGDTGKLALYNGKLFVDDNGTDCCCLAKDCCDVLVAFDQLIVTGHIEATPIGGPETCWEGEADPGVGAEFSSVEDFKICCIEEGGVRKFDVSFSIASSAPCAQSVQQSFEIAQPCCPIDQELTFTGIDPLCQSSGTITIRIQTDPDIECPE